MDKVFKRVFLVLVGVLPRSVVRFLQNVTQVFSCTRCIYTFQGITLQGAIGLAQKDFLSRILQTRSLSINGLSRFIFYNKFTNFYYIKKVITINWLLYTGLFPSLDVGCKNVSSSFRHANPGKSQL